MNNKIAAYIGFAIRKGSVIYGGEALLAGGRVHPKVVLIADDLGETSRKRVVSYCREKGFSVYVARADVLVRCANKNVKVLTVTDKGLGGSVIREIEKDPQGDFNIYTEVQPIDSKE